MSISSPCTITHLPNELIQLIIVDFDRNEHGKLAWCCSKVCRLFRQILLKWAWKEISIDLRSPKFDNTINSIPEWAHVYAKRIHVCDKWSDRRLKSTIEDGHIEHMCTRLPGVTVFVWDSHARLTDAELTALPQHAKVWVTSYAYIEHLVDDYFVPRVLNPIVRKKISKVQLDVHNRLTLHEPIKLLGLEDLELFIHGFAWSGDYIKFYIFTEPMPALTTLRLSIINRWAVDNDYYRKPAGEIEEPIIFEQTPCFTRFSLPVLHTVVVDFFGLGEWPDGWLPLLRVNLESAFEESPGIVFTYAYHNDKGPSSW